MIYVHAYQYSFSPLNIFKKLQHVFLIESKHMETPYHAVSMHLWPDDRKPWFRSMHLELDGGTDACMSIIAFTN